MHILITGGAGFVGSELAVRLTENNHRVVVMDNLVRRGSESNLEKLARHGVTFDEVEGLIDVLRRTREAEVACVLKQGPDSTWRVSLRSLGSVDVRNIAERQGGGGHRFAAGFTSDESAEEIVAQILNAL